MEFKDYYKILGLPRTATAAEVKRAYRKQARLYHPDVNKGETGAERRFKEANEANAVLSDPVKRARYDTLGPDWAGGPSESRDAFRTSDLGDLSDFFRALFDEGQVFGGERVGSPLEASAEVTLEEAFRGTDRLAEVQGKRLTVKIPPGVDTGSRVRLAGAAGPGRDLIVYCVVRPHSIFTRKGEDLQRELPITLIEALLGAKVPVGTLKGQVLLTIPAGTQNGHVFRLAGQGMPRLGKPGAGILRVHIRLVLPKKLSEEAKKAAQRLGDLADQPDPRV